MMNRTTKEDANRGKRRDRAGHRKKRVAPEGMTSDPSNSVSTSGSCAIVETSANISEKHVPNKRLPPLVPPAKALPLKNVDMELHPRESIARKRPIGSEENALGNLPSSGNRAPDRSPSPNPRRRNENMTSYEKMLQRQRGHKKIQKAYAILHSEPEDELDSVRVEQTNTIASGSKTSLQSHSSLAQSRPELNQTLLQYFAKLSGSLEVDDALDFGYIQSLLNDGASVNASDRYGQTLLHEVSRTWGIEVAKFLIDQGKLSNASVLAI